MKKTEREKYLEIEFHQAEELWEYLSPLNEIGGKSIYRGQPDAGFFLQPSVQRKEITSQFITYGRKDWEIQVFNELHLIQKFIEYCDSVGLAIPQDSIHFRDEYINDHTRKELFRDSRIWPERALFPVLSLAQHYGVPTRLLDWTKSSYIATYFAAMSALRNSKSDEERKTKKIAIWALNTEAKGLFSSANIEIIETPFFDNRYIVAQQGCFTLTRDHIDRQHDLVISDLVDKLPSAPLMLRKMTLPVGEVEKVLSFCDAYNVRTATLFPSYSGAADGVSDYLKRNSYKERK